MAQTHGKQLPSHQQFLDHNELRWGEPLGENVGALFQGVDVLGFNTLFLSNMGAEEVVLEGQVPVASTLGCPQTQWIKQGCV
jgi:hypothetical protein